MALGLLVGLSTAHPSATTKDSHVNTRIAFIAGTAITLLASTALAQDVASTAEAPTKASVGAQVELLPVGSFHLGTDQQSMDPSAAVAYGIGGTFDYAVHEHVSIGVAPRLVLNVVPTGDDFDEADDATELDLRARLKVHTPVAPGVEAYGYLAPGYSILFDDDEDVDSATGFAIAVGAGATYDLTPAMYVSGEVGYQKGFQSVEIQNVDVDVNASYLHLGFGAGTRF
jgi:hypothetical protein